MFRSLRKLIMYSILLISLVFLTGFAPLGQSTPEPQTPGVRITQVDTAQFPKVTVYVSVTDSQWRAGGGQPFSACPARERRHHDPR